jgi:hypothetical protein
MVLEDKKEVQGVSPEGKKPYRKPELQIYGDLGSVTKNISGGTHEDKGNVKGADRT